MRRIVIVLALLVGLTWLVAPLSLAAEAAPALTAKSFLTGLIPLLVPALLAVGKRLIPRVPRRILPFVAAALGAVLELAGYYAGLTGGSALLGAIFGAAGVGLREMYDQTRQALRGA